MKITLGKNIASLKAQSKLAEHTNALGSIFERLSSGLRINKASDDPAGLSVATNLKANSRIFTQGVRNITDSISLLNIADSALSSLTQIVMRQRELAEQAASGSFSSTQRAAIDAENQALSQEYERVIQTTKFNGKNILDGTLGKVGVQAGFDNMQLNLLNPGTSYIGTGAYTTQDITFTAENSVRDLTLLTRDLNGDGYDDIIAAGIGGDNHGDGRLYIAIYRGNASGVYSQNSSTSSVISSDWELGKESVNIRFEDGTNNLLISAVVNSYTPGSRLGTYAISAAGSLGAFTAGAGASTNAGTSSVTADLNGDDVNDTVSVVGTNTIRFQTQQTTIASVETLSQSATSLLSTSEALSAITYFEQLQSKVSRAQASTGASLARLQVAGSFTQVQADQAEAAADRILSADIAAETAEMVKRRIMQQAATAILAQANSQPKIALELIGNNER